MGEVVDSKYIALPVNANIARVMAITLRIKFPQLSILK
jgi:hypothetical protein